MERRVASIFRTLMAGIVAFAASSATAGIEVFSGGRSGAGYDIHTKALTPIKEKTPAAGAPMRFVEGGVLKFAIVTDDAKRDDKAVALLREVFQKTTGRAPLVMTPAAAATNGLPFRLVLRPDPALPKEGFSIKTSEGALTISGHVYFGAVDFSERFLGVRWYFPGENGCIYPECRDFAIAPVWYEDAPRYQSRGGVYFLNVSFNGAAQMKRWAPYLGTIKPADWKFLDRWRDGGTLAGGGSHNPFAQKIAKSHPDKLKTIFYTSPQGKFWYNPKSAHLGNIFNVFDLEFADLLVEDWKHYYASGRKPSEDRGGFGGQVNDTFVSFGVCDSYLPVGEVMANPVVKELNLITEKDLARDKDAAMANVYARFYQYLGRKVEKELPGKKLFLLCYYNSKCASLDPRWKLPGNVEVNVCDIRLPLRTRSPKHMEEARQLFREWYEALGGRPALKAWLYSGWTLFGRAVGPEFIGEVPKVLGKYLGNGGLFYDFTGAHDMWHYYYSAYAGWHSQWNPDFDVDAAIDEMWDLCLGPAAGAKMKVFHRELKDAFVKYQACDEAGWVSPSYPVEVIDRLDALLKETEVLLKPGSVEMKRFKLVADFWPEPFKQQRARATYEPPVYEVHRLMPGETPVVDGRPDEAVWAKIPSATFINRFDGRQMPETGSLKLAWDARGVYVLFEGKMGAPKTDGHLWANDTIEVFFSPGLEKEVLSQLAFDVNGGKYFERQRLRPIPQPKDVEWKAEGHEYKAVVTDAGWTAEIFVPFTAFEDGAPKAYDNWNFNCAVTRRGCRPAVEASTSLTGQFHATVDMYGILRFAGRGD